MTRVIFQKIQQAVPHVHAWQAHKESGMYREWEEVYTINQYDRSFFATAPAY